jgi:3-dehydroquinate synthase
MKKLSVTTASGRSEITVGENLSRGLGSLEPRPVLLVDEHVLCQHHDLFGDFEDVVIPAGERYKTQETVDRIHRELMALEVDRSSLLVGVGGGLTTDVAGYAATTYLRGLRFGFISSTLLGQVDASIGGKNGVNLDGYKNMIGTIRQPEFVWCDLSLLRTLARKEYIAGIAEVIKYGAIMDAGFLDYLDENMPALLNMDTEIMEEVVGRSARNKVMIVEKDEREQERRKLLNFGHTVGHAIERDSGLLHGHAISIGMVVAARLSEKLGMLNPGDARRLEALLETAGLPVEPGMNTDNIFENLSKDKKKSGKEVHFVLLEGLGSAVIKPIPLEELKTMLHDLC